MSHFGKRAVLLSPHIDDVPFALGAAMLDGHFGDSTVVNVFSVSRSSYADDSLQAVSAARRGEDDAFFSRVPSRIERVYLECLDAPVRLGITDDDVCATEPPASDSAERDIVATLAALRPARTLVLAPLGLGRHVDHMIVCRAACHAAADGWQVAFYEDLPYAAELSFPEILRSVNELSARIGSPLAPKILEFGELGCSKCQALADYRSQLGPTSLARIQSHAVRLGHAERVWIEAR